ncbi:hypothetical protein [Flavobacterium hydatis]|jgi:hypothetical protein|uniref:Uncharacterized protein n=1 Tax=Flavobacterium hydatis TaxID=991 RepID=A0A086AMJ2_FLAHY|nr:hypothetical protein [Flavobacterium hydatis]KFF17906.1 hypothetical protein IW20_06440 [Flavobacterium hydatis]OXA90927.1 hypothetical protein B0A62_19120 [Flavobacterium hydatis]
MRKKNIPFIDRLDFFFILINLGLLIISGIFIRIFGFEMSNYDKVYYPILIPFFISCLFFSLGLYGFIKTYKKAIIFINEIQVSNKAIILKGLRYNTNWEQTLTINNIEIYLKEQSNRRPYIYHLEFVDEDDAKYSINTSIYWTYPEILAIYKDIKNSQK